LAAGPSSGGLPPWCGPSTLSPLRIRARDFRAKKPIPHLLRHPIWSPGYETYNGLCAVFYYPIGSIGFHASPDFTNHDEAFGGIVFHQKLHGFQRGGSDNRISANADARGLP
jgi:hypothetical protein